MENELYRYQPIVSRPRLVWPDGARVAFYVGLNIEHYKLGVPSTSISGVTAQLVPDPLNHGWRDFSPRVGIWRLIELLDRLGVVPSVLLNSEVCERYPEIIEAGTARGWAWLAHGQNNSTLQPDVAGEREAEFLAGMMRTIEGATGRRPQGWLGPALTETLETPRLLRDLGIRYLLDWCCDEQPFALEVPGLLSVPYSIELNDITLFVGRNLSGPEYERIVVDQLEQLLQDGETTGRVMALPLHPFISNQPFRHKYLARALEHIVSTEGVWVTTSDAIAEHYLADQSDHGE
jgi:allantoinase